MFENGLGVLMPIRGVYGFARYSDTVLTLILNGVLDSLRTIFC
ncbi:hypothetical protein CKU_0311 [Staphylococcus aureus]|nr:hypothetical protein CKU_0311 [Staphylococcus aureus]